MDSIAEPRDLHPSPLAQGQMETSLTYLLTKAIPSTSKCHQGAVSIMKTWLFPPPPRPGLAATAVKRCPRAEVSVISLFFVSSHLHTAPFSVLPYKIPEGLISHPIKRDFSIFRLESQSSFYGGLWIKSCKLLFVATLVL